MEAYTRDCLKADLRNTRTLLGLLVEGAGQTGDAAGRSRTIRQLERVVHDVTVGLREPVSGEPEVDLDSLRRDVETEAADAARERRIAEDTLRQWARSLERVLPWWSALPTEEPLLADHRWPAPAGRAVELRVTAEERLRIERLPGTRELLRARFEKYVSKHAGVEELRLVDDRGAPVLTLLAPAPDHEGDHHGRPAGRLAG